MRGRARDWLQQPQPPVPLRLDRIALYTRSAERPRRQFERVCECTFGTREDRGRAGGSRR